MLPKSGHHIDQRGIDRVKIGLPPEPDVTDGPGLDYFYNLNEQQREVHELVRQALAETGARQNWAYDTRCWGEDFTPGS